MARRAVRFWGKDGAPQLRSEVGLEDLEAGEVDLKPGTLAASYEAACQNAREQTDTGSMYDGGGALLRAVSHPDPALRIAALEVIWRFSEERAAQLLVTLLGDVDPAVRRAAASAAEWVGTRSILSCLMVGLDDADAQVRRACHRAIEAITKKRIALPDSLDEESRSRMRAELEAWRKHERFAELRAAAQGS